MLADIITQLSQSGDLVERQEKRDRLQAKLDRLNEQMDLLVDSHHETFLASLHAFFDVVGKIDNSKTRVHSIRNALMQCKTMLQCKRDHIRHLWIDNLEQTETLRLLDKMYQQTRRRRRRKKRDKKE